MTWDEYYDKACGDLDERFGIMYENAYMSRPEFVRRVAEELFIIRDYDSGFAEETRRQIIAIRAYGVLTFED